VIFFLRMKKRKKFFPEPWLKKHVYSVGQSGAGKSEIQKPVMYDLMRRSKKNKRLSIGLIEPHGDLAQEVLAFKLNWRYRKRLIYINPTIHKLLWIEEIYTPVINPFDIRSKDEDTIDAFAQEITNALGEMIKTSKSGEGGLTKNMDAVIKPCVATLLRKGDCDLRDLKRFMGKNNKEYVELGKKSPDPEHREFFHHGFTNDQYNITKNSLYIKLQSLLNSPVFRRLVIGKSTVDLQKAFNSGKVVIFDVAKSRGRTMAADFWKLMLAYIQAIALRRQDTPKKKRKQTFLFIDEAANYCGSSVEEIMTESRKFWLSLFLSQQIVGQKMSRELTDIIMSNATIKVVGKNAVKSLREMGANINIPLEELKKIPKYEFYIHNKDNEKPAILIKSPDFLVKESDEPSFFYLSKKRRKSLLKYFVYKSGYYIKAADQKELPTDEIEEPGTEPMIEKPEPLIPF